MLPKREYPIFLEWTRFSNRQLYKSIRLNYLPLKERIGMIEVLNKKDNSYQFVVKSDSGKTLLESVDFTDVNSLKHTLNEIKDINLLGKRFERKTNFDGKFLFNLKNDQGKIVGSSGLYTSEAGLENGIKNLKNILMQ